MNNIIKSACFLLVLLETQSAFSSPQRNIGERCQADIHCKNGLICRENRCLEPKNVGGSCQANNDCNSDLYCHAYNHICTERGTMGDLLTPCQNNDDCETKICLAGKICGNKISKGRNCMGAEDCQIGQECNPVLGCVKLYNGKPYQGDYQLSNICTKDKHCSKNSHCVFEIAYNDDKGDEDEDEDEDSNNGIGFCQSGMLNAKCNTSDDCNNNLICKLASKKCENKGNIGQDCRSNAECLANLACNSLTSKCEKPLLSDQKGAGSKCQKDSDCLKGYCFSEWSQCVTGNAANIKGQGSPCVADETCASKHCYLPWQQCVKDLPGSPCEANSDCRYSSDKSYTYMFPKPVYANMRDSIDPDADDIGNVAQAIYNLQSRYGRMPQSNVALKYEGYRISNWSLMACENDRCINQRTPVFEAFKTGVAPALNQFLLGNSKPINILRKQLNSGKKLSSAEALKKEAAETLLPAFDQLLLGASIGNSAELDSIDLDVKQCLLNLSGRPECKRICYWRDLEGRRFNDKGEDITENVREKINSCLNDEDMVTFVLYTIPTI